MKKVTILAAMHGIETYGIDLHDAFVRKFPDLTGSVQLIVGNELAYKSKVRYIDVDMNRAYGEPGDTNEAKEIERVEKQINLFRPDYIIDVHTTKRDSGIFFISDKPNPVRHKLLTMLPIDTCVIQDPVIKKSFIGNHDNAVSLEYSLRSINDSTTEKFIDALAHVIQELENKSTGSIYAVSHLITKLEWTGYAGLKNYDVKPEGVALMVPADNSEMDAEYYGFWCRDYME